MLLLLSHFSRVRHCATPQTAAYQAPPSLGFSRQEHWSGLPFPSPMHESEMVVVKSLSRVRLCDPVDCSLPGSSVHGILQARIWEWVAISFSRGSSSGIEPRPPALEADALTSEPPGKPRMKVKSESEVTQSCPTLSDPMDCSLPGFSIHWIFQARVLEWGAIVYTV